MRFTVIVAFIGLASAIRLRRPEGGENRPPRNDDELKPRENHPPRNDEEEKEQEEEPTGPSPKQIFEQCDANNDQILELKEAIECATKFVTEHISAAWPRDEAGEPKGLDLEGLTAMFEGEREQEEEEEEEEEREEREEEEKEEEEGEDE